MTCKRADPARSKSSTLSDHRFRRYYFLPIISCIAKSTTWVNRPDDLPAVILQRSAPVLVLRLRLRVHPPDAHWHGLCGHSL
jgi:hypothetical protein